MTKNRKVLVTGGAGFIGSHLIPQLLSRRYSVTAMDNLSSGKIENLNEVQADPRFQFVKGDICDKQALRKAIHGVDAVVHLAALIDVTTSIVNPDLTHKVNVTGTLNVLQEAAAFKVTRFVFASSTAVYGDAKTLPITEDAAVNPISPYAASKASAEVYCKAFAECYGLSTVMLRFFNVYGPRNEKSSYSGVITKFLQQAANDEVLTVYGDGKQTRDFINVGDVVEALILALEAKELYGEVFNVCTGTPISINNLVEAIHLATGRDLHVAHAPVRAGEIRFSYGDPSKASRKLKFNAKISLQKGLSSLLKSSKSSG